VDLAERYRFAQVRASGALVEVLSGATAVRRRLIAVQCQAGQEVCTLVPMTRVSVAITLEDSVEEVERALMRRGVSIRCVLERGWLERPQAAASLGEPAAQGQRMAVVEKAPMKIVIADGRVALLPLDPEHGSDAGLGDRFGHAARRAGVVMTVSNWMGVSRPSEVCRRRRW
jgi:hypothetical protein